MCHEWWLRLRGSVFVLLMRWEGLCEREEVIPGGLPLYSVCTIRGVYICDASSRAALKLKHIPSKQRFRLAYSLRLKCPWHYYYRFLGGESKSRLLRRARQLQQSGHHQLVTTVLTSASSHHPLSLHLLQSTAARSCNPHRPQPHRVKSAKGSTGLPVPPWKKGKERKRALLILYFSLSYCPS